MGTAQKTMLAYWEEWWSKVLRLAKQQVPTPPPVMRLRLYQNKPTLVMPPLPTVDPATGQVLVDQTPLPGSWHEEKTTFPKLFDEDLQDWIKLEPVSVRRDQVLRELATIEALETGQGAMENPPELPQPPIFSPPAAPPPQKWP